jgi:membrane protein required for colicin V production
VAMNQWTFIDVVFAGIIIISTVFALRKGLAREIISLAALIGGFIVSSLYYAVPAGGLTDYVKNESIANLLGFLIIFIGCLIVGAVISFIVNRFLKKASIKWIDRLLGGIFGLIRGWAICSIMAIALTAFPLHENLMAQSALAPYILTGARIGAHLVPNKLKESFNEQYKKIVQRWNQSRSAS